MYRKVSDFLQDWSKSEEGTIKVLEALTDDKLDQAIVEGHSTLGWLGWHLASAISYFAGQVGLNVPFNEKHNQVPTKASDILNTYKKVAEEFKQQVEKNFTDESMEEKVDDYGRQTPRGILLRVMIDHQTHHRGQMTVLLRQAGLPVPAVMGPTKEMQQY